MSSEKSAVGIPFWVGVVASAAPLTYLLYGLIAEEPSAEALVLAFSVGMAPAFLIGMLVQAAADFHKKAAAGAARPKHSLLLILLMAGSVGGGFAFTRLTEQWQAFTRDALLCVILLVVVISYLSAAHRKAASEAESSRPIGDPDH
jgi:hypothetical protein